MLGLARWASLFAVVVAFAPRADALCNQTNCQAMSVNTICLQEAYACMTDCSGTQQPYALGNCITYCDVSTYNTAAAGTPCETDNDPCTTDVCDGSGTCTHSGSGTSCGGTCIQSGCCASPNNCTNGMVCPANGGTCACPTGTKTCNGGCVPTSQCCTDADCPSDPANNRHGVCGAGGCAYACNTGYKPCGATCIPQANCCTSSDCTSPPSASCYVKPGTCTNGTCSYAYADGAACDADHNACTANDTCKSGTCVAGPAIVCTQQECHGAPTCDQMTGDCVSAALPNGSACGNDGCSATAGTCSSGTCSSPQKDCSSATTDCKVGVCDVTGPPGAPCTTTNQLNGTACTLADKCQLMTACSGGVCVGTPKTCDAMGACSVAMCNPSTGDCEQSAAPVGTPCDAPNSCIQNATCDATGACTGTALPDGTPCQIDGCTTASACVTGACVCLGAPGTADAPADESPDLGGGGGTGGKGCDAVPGAAGANALALVLGFVALLLRRRVRT